MTWFYAVQVGEQIVYEGPRLSEALKRFQDKAEWQRISNRGLQVTLIQRPYEERQLGGTPQTIIVNKGNHLQRNFMP